MARTFVQVALWVTLAGLVFFVIGYSLLASPWRSEMGRHVLAFMAGLATAVIYGAVIAPNITSIEARLYGWFVVMTLLSIVVWWRNIIFIKYQLEARKKMSDDA